EPIDQMYYLENALQNCIDEHVSIGYKNILDRMPDIGYKPSSRHHFVPISSPVKMLVRLIYDKQDINQVKPWLQQQMAALPTAPPPKPVIQLNILPPEHVVLA